MGWVGDQAGIQPDRVEVGLQMVAQVTVEAEGYLQGPIRPDLASAGASGRPGEPLGAVWLPKVPDIKAAVDTTLAGSAFDQAAVAAHLEQVS